MLFAYNQLSEQDIYKQAFSGTKRKPPQYLEVSLKVFEETVYIQALHGTQRAHTPSLNAEGKTTP